MPIIPALDEFSDRREATTHSMSGRVPEPPAQDGRDGFPLSSETSRHWFSPQVNLDSSNMGWTKEEMRQIQLCDPNVGPVLAWLEAGLRPPREELDAGGPEVKNYWMQWESLTLVDGRRSSISQV